MNRSKALPQSVTSSVFLFPASCWISKKITDNRKPNSGAPGFIAWS